MPVVPMNEWNLARNLAQSLASGPWSKHFIRQTLSRRLPAQLHHLVDKMTVALLRSLPFGYSPDPGVVATALVGLARFQAIHAFCLKHDIWPNPDLSPPQMAPVAAFVKLDVPPLPTLDALAQWLFLPVERMEYLADVAARYEAHEDAAVNHYHYILQPKKSGGLRMIEAPKPHLKAAQRQILHGILDKVPVHNNAFGFVKGRNCLNAAARHAGEQAVVCFDLKDFFASIGSARVFGLFRCLGYPHAVARVLTGLCTSLTPWWILNQLEVADRHNFRKLHLPQGSPASPSLANLAVFAMDRRLSGLAKSLNLNYSRYADDLSFSGDRESIGCLLRTVPEIVADEGFQLNPAKTRIMSNTSRQVVTGVVVNQHLNVDRREYDRVKAIIHACGKPHDTRLGDPRFRAALLGKIGWIEAVNRHKGQKLLQMLSDVAAGSR